MALTYKKPTGLLRWALRLPIFFYRIGLGRLMGNRFLMLTHTGRKSGTPHQTVIEVVRHDAQTGVYTIASGWGPKADWYRNIQKTPQVQVDVNGKRFSAQAKPLTIDNAVIALQDYAQKHPAAFRELSVVMMGERMELNAESYQKMAEKIPLVVLQPV